MKDDDPSLKEPHFLNETTAQFLDWNWVIKKLKGLSFSCLGRNGLDYLAFARNEHDVQQLLNQTKEMIHWIQASNLRSLVNNLKLEPFDVELQHVAHHKGTFLSSQNLFELALSLQSIHKIKDILQTKKPGYLSQITDAIQPLNQVQKDIFNAIDSEYAVKDDASEILKSIRSKKRFAKQKVENTLKNLMQSSTYRNCVQDELITVRNDRYVIPIKRDKESSLEGIISNISSKGNTVFFEPTCVIEHNNYRIQLESEEQEEIIQILKQLTDLVQTKHQNIQCNFEQITQLDIIYAKALFSIQLNGQYPQLNSKGIFQLICASHPILMEQYQGQQTPIDVFIGKSYQLLIISGPNTGGKTLTLKTIGLLTAMIHTGILPPLNEQSQISICDRILSHYGDTQNIYDGLSSFSSHIKELMSLLNQAQASSLILIDEPISNTDPKQGSALGNAILEKLIQIGSRTIVSTHYQEIKHHFIGVDKAMNACLFFDKNNEKPTYQIRYQHIGESQALAIAQQLGLPDSILNRAKQIHQQIQSPLDEKKNNFLLISQQLAKEKAHVTDLEIKLKQTISHMSHKESQRLIEYDLLARENQQWQNKYLNQKKDNILSERKLYLNLMNALKELQQKTATHDQIKPISQTVRQQLKQLDSSLTKTKQQFHQFSKKTKQAIQSSSSKDSLKIGDLVHVITLNQKATLIQLSKTQAKVQLGQITLTTDINNLKAIPQNKIKKSLYIQDYSVKLLESTKTPPLELHIRGQYLEEAMHNTQLYIENLYSQGRKHGRIVHGKGMGILRNAIHQMLDSHTYIKSFQLCPKGLGEHGVTEIKLH